MTPTDTLTVNCPFCESDAPRPWRESPDRLLHRLDRRWKAVECTHCGTRYTDPRPTPESLGQHYPENYEPYHANVEAERKFRFADPDRLRPEDRAFMTEQLGYAGWARPGDPIGRNALGTRAMIRNVPPMYTASPGRWLDIGCSHGLYLELIRELGWQVEGLEMSEESAKFAREHRDLDVKTGLFEKGMYDANSFEGVSMWHVLEHMENPLDVLRDIHRMLTPGGLLLIGVPNNAGMLARLAGNYWFPLEMPRHFTHFTPESLTKFCEKAGFRVERLFHFPSILDFMRSGSYWLNAHVGIKQGDWLWRMVNHRRFRKLDRKLGVWAARRGHSSRLTLIARKAG